MRKVIARIIEQDVAESPADDDPDRAIDEQVVDAVGAGTRRPAPQLSSATMRRISAQPAISPAI